MAPNKKKKKPASNPARGFATTSTASKPKYDEARELETDIRLGESDGKVPSSPAEDGVHSEDLSSRKPEKALHELTPEELESQLENSGLQILVENHGEKLKKGASRQISQIQTEKRLLRSQAEHLDVRQWLPPEIMQIITDLLHAQDASYGVLQANFESTRLATDISEDDLLIKLWALRRLLPLLGFPERRTDLALCHLLKTTNKLGSQSLSSSKDSIWGFDECLAWLALDSDPADLPKFDSREGQSQRSIEQQRHGVMTNIPGTNPTDSARESPLGNKDSLQQPQTPNEDLSLSSASDPDSDAEPEQLVDKYLDLQSRLYEISSELTNSDGKRPRNGKVKHPVIKGSLDSASKRRSERLMAKICKIKSDLLFDEDKAYTRWAEIRNDLEQEAAERKRLGIRNDEEQQKVTPTVRKNTVSTDSNISDDDTDGMLSGFFNSLPETTTDPATGLSIISTASQEGTRVEIRDFGKWNGMSPRRVLEEACKARWDFHLVSLVVYADIR